MSSSISDLSTSTSPHFRCLTGSVVPRSELTLDERDEMYELLETYFSGTDRNRFELDLAEKEAVILLRDAEGIQGFSTFMRIEEENLVAFFSGDTIVARRYWGETLLSRLWGQTIVSEAERISGKRVYWFLICSGYKTWRFLPVFFREFYPHPDRPTPIDAQRILDTLGRRKFADEYHSGVVRFRHPTPLRPGVAEITEQRLRDSRIEFFARMNPGHATGDELACLTEVSRANLTRAGQRMLA